MFLFDYVYLNIITRATDLRYYATTSTATLPFCKYIWHVITAKA